MAQNPEIEIRHHKHKLQSWRINDSSMIAEVVIDENDDVVDFKMPRDAFELLLTRAGFEKHSG